MKIWVVEIGEPLPIDGSDVRLMRMGLICQILVRRGHKVTWWASTYDHYHKKNRFSSENAVELNENCKIKFIKSIGYKKNISLRRFLDNILLSQRFKKLAVLEEKPDVILCSVPVVELAYQCVKYGERFNVPVVLDLRDMWPDIFVEVMPSYLRWFAKIILYPKFVEMQYACFHANALLSITEDFLRWGLSYVGRDKSSLDGVFPLAYPVTIPDDSLIESLYFYWQEKNIVRDGKDLVITYIGSLNKVHEDEVVFLIKAILSTDLPVKLVVVGKGDNLEKYKQLAGSSEKIIFPGWANQKQIWTLLRLSSLGIIPYKNRFDYMSAIPNKFNEYLSAGLPVITNLKGSVRKVILNHKCGFIYEDDDREGFLSVLKNIITDKDKLKVMSENAKRVYNERFVAEKVYSNLCDHLEKVVDCYYGRVVL